VDAAWERSPAVEPRAQMATDEMSGCLDDVVELVRGATDAVTVLAVTRTESGRGVAAASGGPADLAGLDLPDDLDGTAELPVPAAWGGVDRITVHAFPRAGVHLLIALPSGAADDQGLHRLLAVADAALGRLAVEAELADLVTRVDNAQSLANMGDYDWHIATNTNRWSDQLFRIYGYEPQAFSSTYDRFLAHVHPDDRERIQAIHQHAYATGEPYQMIERIVRPDGEIRYLSSNGQVVQDSSGTPVRMRGTCIDITAQLLAQQAEEASSERFRSLVESSPDAIVVYDRTGGILQANGRAGDLLGGDPVGRSIREVLSWPLPQTAHGVRAHTLDGRAALLDVATAALSTSEDNGLVAAFLHDAEPRLKAEAIAGRLRDARVRRRQALELNDSVIQGLTASVLALQSEDIKACSDFLGHTLSAARRMMNEWLETLEGGDLNPGDLVRASPSSFEDQETDMIDVPEPEPTNETAPEMPRILLVEDNSDVRRMLRLKLEAIGAYEVVGEAADGLEAVERATELMPSVVLLDLAMPRMDGLTALPLILEAVPDVRVVVLSGFDQATMAEHALAAGAHAYLEKGLRMDLDRVIRDVLGVVESERAG